MPINFPQKPGLVDGQLYPAAGAAGPDDLQFVYDLTNNAWNLVAPNNVATIDYVDDKVASDTRNIRRNYDLHHGTNTVTLDNGFLPVRIVSCENLALSGLNTELYTLNGVDLPIGESNDLSDVLKNGYSIPVWFGCVDTKLNPKEVVVLGMSPSTNDFSLNFKHTVALFFSKDSLDESSIDASNLIEGSCIEIQRDAGSSNGFTDDAYTVYKINSVEQHTNGVGISVMYVDSYNAEGRTDVYTLSQRHTFVTYAKSIDATGGDLEGPLNITYDSANTFTVSQTTDPNTMVFKVDTTNGLVLTNEAYNIKILDREQTTFLYGMATVDYVNTRLGLDGPIYNSTFNGPYFRISGDTVTGRAIFDQGGMSNGAKSFSIMGAPTPSASDPALQGKRELLYFEKQSSGDRLLYTGLVQDTLEVTNKEYVDTEVQELKDDTEATYIKRAGDGPITGKLYYNDSTTAKDLSNNDLVPWKKVKDITVAQVLDGYPASDDVKGVIYQNGDYLYYRSY